MTIPSLEGALVEEVIPDTPAQEAGLRHGDVIREVDGEKIENSKALQQIISHKNPGQGVQVVVIRNGERKEFTVELEKLPAQLTAMKKVEKKKNIIGLTAEEMPKQMGPPGEKGVIITEIEPGGPADDGGLMKGDIILEINMQEIGDGKEFQEIVDELKPDQWVSFYIRRGNQTLYKAVKIPSNQK
jgi:serine protease Do